MSVLKPLFIFAICILQVKTSYEMNTAFTLFKDQILSDVGETSLLNLWDLRPFENPETGDYKAIINYHINRGTSTVQEDFAVYTINPQEKTTEFLKKVTFDAVHFRNYLNPDYEISNGYMLASGYSVVAWDVQNQDDNNVIVWASPRSLTQNSVIGNKITAIKDSTFFLCGEKRFGSSSATEIPKIYGLDLLDQTDVKVFNLGTEVTFKSFFEFTKKGAFLISSGQKSDFTWSEVIFDITNGYEPNGPLANENADITSFDSVKYCFPDDENEMSFFRFPGAQISSLGMFRWGSYPTEIQEDTIFKRLDANGNERNQDCTIFSLRAIPKTKMVTLGIQSQFALGDLEVMIFVEFGDVSKPQYVLNSDNSDLEFGFMQGFDSLKLQMIIASDNPPNVFDKLYRVMFTTIPGEVFPCLDALSSECDPIEAVRSNSCIEERGYLKEGATTCSCYKGYRVGDECPLCPGDGFRCDGPLETQQILCSVGAYVDPSGRCQNCTILEDGVETPASCSDPLDLGIENLEVDILEKNFEIVLNSDIDSMIMENGNDTDNFSNSVRIEDLLAIEKEAILKANNTVRALYAIEFLKEENLTKIRVSIEDDLSIKEGNKINIMTTPNIVYRRSVDPLPGVPFFLYTKQKSVSINVINRSKEQIKASVDRTFTYIWIVIVASLVSGFLTKMGLRTLIYLIKYFQILDIISNFGKINIFYTMALRKTIDFIDELGFPTFKFLERMTVIYDGEEDGFEDLYAYQEYRSGKRDKVTTSNEDIFIFQGINFVYSLFLTLTFPLVLVLSCFTCDSRVYKVVKNITNGFHFFILGTFFFDFQLLVVNGVSIHDFKRNQPFKFRFSYIISLTILTMMLYYLNTSYNLLLRKSEGALMRKIEKKMKKKDKEKMEKTGKKPKGKTGKDKKKQKEKVDYKDYLILRFFTEELNNSAIKRGSKAVLLDNYRFFAIQVLISTFQLQKMAQSILIFSVNSIYFGFYLKKLSRSKNGKIIYDGIFTSFKMITKEICIQTFLTIVLGISLFSEFKVDYKESITYRVFEILAIVMIAVAVIGEFLMLLQPIYELGKQVISFIYQKLKAKKTKVKPSTKKKRRKSKVVKIKDEEIKVADSERMVLKPEKEEGKGPKEPEDNVQFFGIKMESGKKKPEIKNVRQVKRVKKQRKMKIESLSKSKHANDDEDRKKRSDRKFKKKTMD